MTPALEPPSSESASLTRELELRRLKTRLSANDERILRFIEEHADELAFYTSESIAQGASVSRAAVVRFARRLGYTGFSDLRAQYRAEYLRATHGDREPSRSPSDQTFLGRKIRRDIENVGLLTGTLAGELEAAASILAGARFVWLVANRETYGLMLYFYRLLHHARRNLRLVEPAFPDPLRDARPTDALLGCTFRPYAHQTLTLAAYARTAGASVIAVTDGAGKRLFSDSDVVLTVPVESTTVFLSFVAVTAVLEALAALVARVDADETFDTLEATGSFVGAQRLMVDPGPVTGKRRSTRRAPRAPVARSDDLGSFEGGSA